VASRLVFGLSTFEGHRDSPIAATSADVNDCWLVALSFSGNLRRGKGLALYNIADKMQLGEKS
jgi:hypothetical protein